MCSRLGKILFNLAKRLPHLTTFIQNILDRIPNEKNFRDESEVGDCYAENGNRPIFEAENF